jgi:hypothetical protein
VVKPTLVNGFDYRKMNWADLPFANEAASMVPEEADADEAMRPAGRTSEA